MIDKRFLINLEYTISIALENTFGKKKSHYWCDGIYLLDSEEYSREKISVTRKTVMRAAIPKGQYEEKEFRYDFVLKFGECVLEKYITGKRLEDCIPSTDNADWIKLDTENKIIEVQLN